MKALLVKLFVGSQALSAEDMRYRYGRMCGIVGVIINATICIFELVVGILVGSIAMVSDAVHNITDAGGALLTLLSFKLSSAKADESHPYGHGRMEYLLSIGFALVLFVVAIQLGLESYDRIVNPTPVVFSWTAVAVMIVAMLLKLWLSFFLKGIGRQIDSPILEANGKESLADVGATGAILVGLLIGMIVDIHVDGYLGIIVSLLIFSAGYHILMEATNRILGDEPSPKRVLEIKTFVKNYPGVLGVHHLLIHDYGPGQQYASIHVEVDANMGVMESHTLLDRIEHDIKDKLGIHLTTHLDPLELDETTKDWGKRLNSIVKGCCEKGEVHDIRLFHEADKDVLSFVVIMPFSGPSEAEVQRLVYGCIAAIDPHITPHMHYYQSALS